MTRTTFRKLITQAAALLLATITILLVMNLVTNQRLESEKQAGLQQNLGIVLPAQKYIGISLIPYLEKYPSIEMAYAAFDDAGKLLGYIIDVTAETEIGKITTRMSFSLDGETLIALRVLDDGEKTTENEKVRTLDFYNQFANIRLPAALHSDLPDQDLISKGYPAIAGLTDGTFRETQHEADEAGYKDFVEIVIKDGRIVQVTWDATQTDGGINRAKSSVDGSYVLPDNKVIWAAQAYAMQNKLIEVQDPAKIAIKSDGTTEVVTDVSVSVNAFLTLANKCIEDSKNGLAAASVTPSGEATGEVSGEVSGETTGEVSGETSDETSGESNAGDTPTPAAPQTTESTAAPGSTAEDPAQETTEVYTGSEDGVVPNSENGALPDTIDGLPLSSIKTRITAAEGAQQTSRIVVSTVNQAYVFLKEYLIGEP